MKSMLNNLSTIKVISIVILMAYQVIHSQS